MKRFMTMLAFGVSMLFVENAIAASFIWDGCNNDNWKETSGTVCAFNNNNWNTGGFPGQSASGDNATIDASDANLSVPFCVDLLSSLGANTINNLSIRDGTFDNRVFLFVGDSDGTADEGFMKVTGTMSIEERSGQSGSYVEVQGDDKIEVRGTFQVVGGSSTAVTITYTGSGSIVTIA